MKYYFAVDNSVQWFTGIFAVNENEIQEAGIEVPMSIRGPFIQNITSRELHFRDKPFLLPNRSWDDYSGWSISEGEFKHIKRLVELEPYVREYNKILNHGL